MRTEFCGIALHVELPHVVVVMVGGTPYYTGRHAFDFKIGLYGIILNCRRVERRTGVIAFVRATQIVYPLRTTPAGVHETGLKVGLRSARCLFTVVVGHGHTPVVTCRGFGSKALGLYVCRFR